MFLRYFDRHTKKFPQDAVAAFNALEAAMVERQGTNPMHTKPTDLFNASMLQFYDIDDTRAANNDDDVELLVMHCLILHVSPSMWPLDAMTADAEFSPPMDFSGEGRDDESFASKMEVDDKDDDDGDDVAELPKSKHSTPKKGSKKRPASSQKKTPANKGTSSQKKTPVSKGTRSSTRTTSSAKRRRTK